ncbi:hypothetical protein [Paraburkholderia piptadeniae]|uniref:hypothetical protein n=1 Tax=Paraburkholderia piptadeniae TaxID=1701573 RepID=UPI00117EA742|nr:hypothetical protein [Paraburkholderia piptadeniae]
MSQTNATYGTKAARSRRHLAALDIEFARQWCKAAETAHELETRYTLVLPDETIMRPSNLSSPLSP